MSIVNQHDRVYVKLFLRTTPSELGEEELAYFREHPDQIDEVTAPVKEALGPNADYWQTAENSRMR